MKVGGRQGGRGEREGGSERKDRGNGELEIEGGRRRERSKGILRDEGR